MKKKMQIINMLNFRVKSTYLQKLEEVFTFKVGVYTYHHGNVINTTFI
jgi:hypothetical protein